MEPEKKSNGAFVGLVIIIIILVVGGVYIWMSNQKTQKVMREQAEKWSNEDAAQLEALLQATQSTSTATEVDVQKIN